MSLAYRRDCVLMNDDLLLFIMEFRNLTNEEAADAYMYMFGVDVQ